MTATIKPFQIKLGDLNFIHNQVAFPGIRLLGYDADGRAIYGYFDPNGIMHPLGELGTFDPLQVINPDTGLPIYASARVADGLRDTSGAYNNLTQGWEGFGASERPFMRDMTHPDYNNYLVQHADNPAFQAAPGQTVDAVDSNLIHNGDAYANPLSNVVDYTPRMISQTITNSGYVGNDPSMPYANQAFADALAAQTDAAGGDAQQNDGFIRSLNSVSGDPGYSGWFVLFGQFFDHGLDFIGKPSGNATITIPLAPTDPLYGQPGPDGQPVYALHISRATVDNPQGAGPDGKFYTADDVNPGPDKLYGTADDVTGPLSPDYVNHTSPYIDQSQTYGSEEQVTTLLREWVEDPNTPGHFIPGAALFDGQTLSDDAAWHLPDGTLTHQTLPTLSELRQHLADTSRDDLTWEDIGNYRARDAQGRVLDVDPSAAGVQVAYTGHSLLLDMNPHFDAAHVTGLAKLQSIDSTIDHLDFSAPSPFGFAVVYSDSSTKTLLDFLDFSTFSIRTDISATDQIVANELLLESVGDHYIAGDGRANENFGLTALHHVFHEDHNVQLLNLEDQILKQQLADPGYAHQWQVAVAATGPATGAGVTVVSGHYEDANGNYVTADGAVSWNNEHIFQATKLVVEMEYQHVAIDQYARLITPDLPEFVTYDSAINADISLEYGEAAFRFGHSQLRDTIDALEKDASGTYDLTGAVTQYGLAQAFLVPGQFADIGPTAIALGMSRQVGNETDEFVTPALQQSLLGQPLDLPAINIARGRDLGLPTLNEARQQIHDAIIAERNADPNTPHHTNIIVDALTPYTSWNDFANNMIHPESLVNFIAAYAFDGDIAKANAILGLDNGTIAEGDPEAMGFTLEQATNFLIGAKNPDGTFVVDGAGGFNNIDLWIGGLAEKHVYGGFLGPTFNAIFEDQMERLMDGDRFYYLYRLDLALPLTTDLNQQIVTEQFKDIIERTTDATHLNGDVMTYADSYVELSYYATDGGAGSAFKTEHKYGYFLDSYAAAHGGQHIGIYTTGGGGGTAGNGTIVHLTNADTGVTEAYVRDYRPDIGTNPDGTAHIGYNSHEVVAGTDYNDWIDAGDGDDTIYGDGGDDVLDGKSGADHVYGGDGNDVIYGGDIDDFLDGGAGDDIIYAGSAAGATDVVIGGTGNDHLYGEAGIDEIHGDDGDDFIDAGGDTDIAFGDGGNDEMHGGDGPDELRGGLGDDIVSGGSGPDLLLGEGGDDIIMGGIGGGAAQGDGDEVLGDVGFDIASFADSTVVLDVAADLNNQNLTAAPGVFPPFEPFNTLITGVEGLVGTKFVDTLRGDGGDNWLIGGSGNDVQQGNAGNDVIVGDSIRLDVLVGHWHKSHDVAGNDILNQDSPGLLDTQGFADHFTDLLTSRPDYVLGETNSAGTSDKVVFNGNRADYDVTVLLYNTVTGTIVTSAGPNVITLYKIADHRPGAPDGTDLVMGVELFQFADRTLTEAQLLNQAPTDIQWNAVAPSNTSLPGTGLIAQLSTVDPDSASWTYSLQPGSSAGFAVNAATGNVTRTGSGLSTNTTYTLNVRSTDDGGKFLDETFTIRTGNNNNNDLTAFATTHDDIIYALGGNDVVVGGLGNDTLFGQSGDDTLNGGDGNDVLNGGSGDDTATYASATLGVTVSLAVSGPQNTVGSGIDTLSGIENLTGSAFADTLTGNTAANELTGGGGNDALNGGGGTDTAIFSGPFANYGFSLNGAGNVVVTDLAAGSPDGSDALNSIEQMQFGNATFDVVAGTNTGQTLNGSGGADILLGFGGNDTLNGNNGSDVLVGGAGNDTLNGGGGGSDTAVFSGPLANYSFSINGAGNLVVTDISAGSPDGSDTLNSIEQVRFGNTLLDLVTGTNGNNNLNGSNAADLLLGLNGNDTLNGGGGADVMVGGGGTDRYVFTASSTANGDAIIDFQAQSEVGAAHDIIDVSGIDANGSLAGNGTFTYGGEVTSFSARGQLISYLDTGTGHYMLAGNTDGNNATAEFQIDLGTTHKVLSAADFVL